MPNYENLREYAWNYFQLHAGQRLTTFNYYIVISSLLTSGYFIAVKEFPLLGSFLGIVLIAFSYVFWKLDSRNKQLIKNAENALKYIESKDTIEDRATEPHILNIFIYEEKQTAGIQAKKSLPWKKLYSYSNCLNLVFLLFAILGFLAIVYSIVIMLFPNFSIG